MSGMALDTRPRPFPPAEDIAGNSVRLEAIVDERRFAELYAALGERSFDAGWDYLAVGPFESREAFDSIAGAMLLTDASRFYAVVPKSTGRAEGFLSLMRVDQANGVIEIGNIVLGPALQRSRTATDTFFTVFAHVFETLGYRRLEWKCNDLNAPSKRAAERLGFTYEGLFRQHMIVKGKNRDTAWFAMLDGEWPSRRAAFEAWLDDGNFDASGRQKRGLMELR